MSQTRAIVEIIDVRVDQIKPSPYQPRLTFNLEDIRGSIQRDGILVPLTVRKKDGYYELIDGERRVRLAKELGYKTVPCTIVDVDDEIARRMVWKVNTLRQEYTPKEKAYYFKKLQEAYGMSLRGIARECDYAEDTVVAHLNALKLPKKYQNLVWDGPLSVSHIQELRPWFNEGAMDIAHIIEWLDQVLAQKLTSKELREALSPELKEVEEKRVKAAREAVPEVVPEAKVPETPEEFEEAAKILSRRAKELKTPEQKHQELVDKTWKALGSFPSLEKAEKLRIDIVPYKEKLEKIESYLKEKPKEAWDDIKSLKKEFKAEIKEAERRREEEEKRHREEEMRRRIEEEAKKRARELEEAEKRRIEEEARKKAQEEILSTPELVKELVKRPEIRQALEETKKVEIPPQKKGYLTLEEPLPVQYQHQREWNLKQLVGRRLNGKEFRFDFVTIGYSQKTLQDLVSLLKLAEVRFLIDVRRNPQSMYKPEFNKNRLEKDLTEIGVKYVHLPQLGIPRQARNEVYEGSITPKELLERYERVVLKTNGLSKLLEIVKGKGTFALMCTEVDPTMCHRNKIAQALVEKGMVGYDL